MPGCPEISRKPGKFLSGKKFPGKFCPDFARTGKFRALVI